MRYSEEHKSKAKPHMGSDFLHHCAQRMTSESDLSEAAFPQSCHAVVSGLPQNNLLALSEHQQLGRYTQWCLAALQRETERQRPENRPHRIPEFIFARIPGVSPPLGLGLGRDSTLCRGVIRKVLLVFVRIVELDGHLSSPA